MKVKICGLKSPANIDQVLACGPDFVGFVFYEPSPRYARDTLSPVHMQNLASGVGRVGVFVDEKLDVVARSVQDFCLSHIQLHGSEPVRYLEDLRARLPGIPVFKAFAVTDSFDFAAVVPYENLVTAVIFDTPSAGHGGSGQTFPWERLAAYVAGPRFFLSGGLSCENVAAAKDFVHKHPLGEGLDASSGLEKEPGIKAISLVTRFIDEAKK